MKRQHLTCKAGQHGWSRESQRGKPPLNCPSHNPKASRFAQATVISISDEIVTTTEDSGPAISGVALADRVMASLASRGQLLSQQTINPKTGTMVYAGPRY